MTLQSHPWLWFYLICITLIACSGKKTDPFEEEKRAHKKEKEVRLDYLRARFPGINEFKATDDPLTVTLQELLRNNELFLLTDFKLIDVSRGDSTWTVKLRSLFRTNHIVELICDSAMAQHVIDISTPKGDPNMNRRYRLRRPSAIVARVSSISRIELYSTSTSENEGDDGYSRIELDADLPLRIVGELVDVQ